MKELIPSLFCSATILGALLLPLQSSSASTHNNSHANSHSNPHIYSNAQTMHTVEAIRAEDEQLIRAQAKDYALEYGRGNAAALAAQWAPDGTFTDSTGQQFHGRPEIEKSFTQFFKANGIHPLTIEVESIKFPAPNIAIEVGASHTDKGDDAKYTAIHSKETGHWQMVAVFEHEYVPEAASITLNDLSWLIGSWQANADTRMQCDWTASKQFLKLDFYSTKSDNTPTETEIIGLNPMSRHITSWHFNSDGGVAYGRWNKDSDRWLINARGTEHSGASATAQYVLHKIDDNNYSWKSTKRFSAGKALPDTGEVLLLRRSK